ncbi:hypothetical protein LVJ94_35155 [Pendulispora rubella]|uniref:Uncharacterized protein n=1 Tax=Pendulispora rubella TaxID=2741070 RepID=A0ABZ2KYQ7_9BACT
MAAAMLANVRWRAAATGHALARRALRRWTLEKARRLCERGEHYLAARLLRVVNVVPAKRCGGAFVGAYVDVIHVVVLEAQLEALAARIRGDDRLADEYESIGKLLRRCHFVPWWAWWMRWAARRRPGLELSESESMLDGNEYGDEPFTRAPRDTPNGPLDATVREDVRSTRAWWCDVRVARRSG